MCCPGCKLPTPRGNTYKRTRGKVGKPERNKTEARRSQKRSTPKGKKQINPIIVVPALVLAVLLFGVGSYVAMTLWQEGQAIDAGSLEAVLNKVRVLPSNQTGQTIEEYLDQRVELSRDEGRLLEAQGWDARPLANKQFLVTFTFEERGNLHYRAEWQVDLASNRVTPKNELAAKVYKKD
jgi:hypothetical protein